MLDRKKMPNRIDREPAHASWPYFIAYISSQFWFMLECVDIDTSPHGQCVLVRIFCCLLLAFEGIFCCTFMCWLRGVIQKHIANNIHCWDARAWIELSKRKSNPMILRMHGAIGAARHRFMNYDGAVIRTWLKVLCVPLPLCRRAVLWLALFRINSILCAFIIHVLRFKSRTQRSCKKIIRQIDTTTTKNAQ